MKIRLISRNESIEDNIYILRVLSSRSLYRLKKFVDGIFKLLILTKEGKESPSNKHVSLLIRCIFRPSKCIKKKSLKNTNAKDTCCSHLDIPSQKGI